MDLDFEEISDGELEEEARVKGKFNKIESKKNFTKKKMLFQDWVMH